MENKIFWNFETTREKLDKSEHGLRWLMRTDESFRECMKRIGNGRGKIYFDPDKIKAWAEGKGLTMNGGS